MADLLSPSAAAVQPVAEAIQERPYRELRPQAKKRVPVNRRPQHEPPTETEAGLPDDDQPKHTLDIDA
jgi:hypothetical protein